MAFKTKSKHPQPIMDEDGSNLRVWDWIVTKHGEIRQIEHDDQMDLPFEIINRFATKDEINQTVTGRKA